MMKDSVKKASEYAYLKVFEKHMDKWVKQITDDVDDRIMEEMIEFYDFGKVVDSRPVISFVKTYEACSDGCCHYDMVEIYADGDLIGKVVDEIHEVVAFLVSNYDTGFRVDDK